jgi:hypothetical protein
MIHLLSLIFFQQKSRYNWVKAQNSQDKNSLNGQIDKIIRKFGQIVGNSLNQFYTIYTLIYQLIFYTN